MYFSTSNPEKFSPAAGCFHACFPLQNVFQRLKSFKKKSACGGLLSHQSHLLCHAYSVSIVLRIVEASSAPRNHIARPRPHSSQKQLSQMTEASSCSRKISKNYPNAGPKTFSQTVEAPPCIRKYNLNTHYHVPQNVWAHASSV